MNRRDFIQLAGQLGLFSVASALLPWRALGVQTSSGLPQFFILMHVQGGWDTSLCMDPWTSEARLDEKDFFIEYRHDELLPFRDSFVGPALAPLRNHFDRMTLINGVFMTATDGGHDSAALYASSGNGQGGLGVLPLELEGRLFTSPFGTISDTAPYAGQSSKPILNLGNLVSSGQLGGGELLVDFGDPSTELSQARQSMINYNSRIALFNNLIKQYPERSEATSIAALFRAGLSCSAFLDESSGNLDSHSNHPQSHLGNLKTAFENLNKILDILKKSPGTNGAGTDLETHSLLDQTTVMVISEFTRTPALNASRGKDHNPQCNSVLLFSPQMKNMKIGASTVVTRAKSKYGTPYLAGLPLDLATEQAVRHRENSFILRPENVVATVLKSMNVDPSSISRGLGSARVLSSIIK